MSEQFEQPCWFECEDVIFMILMMKKKHVKKPIWGCFILVNQKIIALWHLYSVVSIIVLMQ